MAKVSSVWQQVQVSARRLNLSVLQSGLATWALVLLTSAALLLWNWKLVLATGVGVTMMALVYVLQSWDWRLHWSDIRRFLSGPNRQLVLSVGTGAMATLTTYIAVSIWTDAQSRWLASGAILQGLATLAVLLLLVWEIINRHAQQDDEEISRLLSDLTETDPLKRLIAVRQLHRFVRRIPLNADQRQTLSDSFRMLLGRESEETVREAVFESLEVMETQSLGRGR
ncbi:hypothetical protein [Leptolyngbya sp. FACHB-261]|uniref:hypothetical protein n=1 Tax=Leptolyngbya sp. FACHB-261 TaxID=2692806 RepID=UPI0016848632|nr:hypothetical protein [Leptolyngbya sp. FACHB-261]MBD2102017.1 hypothetical protein [Leptolyngbya sp. FACHB-261]